MIETITINDQELDVCLNADSITRPERTAPYLFLARRLAEKKKRFYVESEGFVYFSEQPAVSLAAQLVRWIRTDIQPGQHHVLLPFDTVVYIAVIQVHADYILVESETLETFEKSMALVKSNPQNCKVGRLGRLSASFQQHQVELQDLRINLGAGAANPFRFRRGYTLGDVCAAAGMALVACAALALAAQQSLRRQEEAPVEETVETPVSAQVHPYLAEVGRLLPAIAVLLAYDLRSVKVSRVGDQYATSAQGEYRSSLSLARLQELAGEMNGRLIVNGSSWTLNSSLFAPPPAAEEAPAPLHDAFEQYRRLAWRMNARYDIVGVSRRRRGSTGVVALTMRHPNPAFLAYCAGLMKIHRLHGALQSLELTTGRHGAWQSLTATIEITGA